MHEDERKLERVEERIHVSKKSISDGRVVLATATDIVPVLTTVNLQRDDVDVERVRLNRTVDEVPKVRVDGDTTIVPVIEERLVVQKKLVLVAEIRLRRRSTIQPQRVETELRQQRVTVERTSEDTKPRRNIMAELYNENARDLTAGTYNTLSAFFDSRSDAESAVSRLREAGVDERDIRFMPGYEADSETANVASDDRRGFWAALGEWFFPDEDRATYAEGLRRGGFLVSVSNLSDALHETAHDILDDEGSIDIDERADLWRQEGWSTHRSTDGFATPAYDRNVAAEADLAVSGDADRVTSGDASRKQPKLDNEVDAVAQASASREDAFEPAARDQTIPVVEENLRVGKRDINNGSVRVRAYTVKQPVREDVSLRDEKVEIERRAVDRPLADADRAFQNRTISAEDHHEEPVVQKDAHVVEEVGIRKNASERTETINDSVSKTEVEIDDDRNGLSQSQTGSDQSQSQGYRRD
ncbi:YsnF/AvaK domain-containing protein [Rhizobium sp. P38BS-XIX]|uniref:YsnF/AvaK domain-containing protein n=1 Tax=Rhizobium sp. P38BS-XIX TaxID=2726740 RepID=UPI0014567534|nr:YsnF/AvaK domain-containing protein [Rhizobium sp. P38BS-XIX]NLR97052.1 YsnF/AvaK domain-containing protein [Rhizobium sp. P38BS-XIX]